MIKRNAFLLFLMLLVSQITFAQSVKVDWGNPEMQDLKKSQVAGVIGADNSFYYLRKVRAGGLFSSGKVFIERFNNDHEQDYSVQIDYENKKIKEKIDPEGEILTKKNIVVFGSDYDRKTDRNTLYACTYSLDGKLESDWEEVDEIVSKKKNNAGNFTLQLSENKEKILILHNEPYKKDENEKFNYKVIDSDLKTIWEKKVTLKLKDKNVSISGYKIDYDGNVVMLARITSEGKTNKKASNYSFKILQYDYESEEMSEINLSLGKLFMNEITFKLAPNNKIVVSGFYSKTWGDQIVGAFYQRIDREKMEAEITGHKDFPKNFLTQYMSEKKVKKGRELYAFDLDHLVLKDDGGAVLVAEQYYVQVVTTTTRGANGVTMTTTTYYYYYKDIIVVSINPDATIQWIKRIPKFQYSVNDGGYFSSYVFAVKGNKMFFAYNDNIKNMKPKTGKKKDDVYVMNRPKKAVVHLTTLDVNGNIEDEILFSAKSDAKKILRPKLYYQYNDDKVLIYSEYRNKYKIGTLVLPN